MTGDFLLLRAG